MSLNQSQSQAQSQSFSSLPAPPSPASSPLSPSPASSPPSSPPSLPSHTRHLLPPHLPNPMPRYQPAARSEALSASVASNDNSAAGPDHYILNDPLLRPAISNYYTSSNSASNSAQTARPFRCSVDPACNCLFSSLSPHHSNSCLSCSRLDRPKLIGYSAGFMFAVAWWLFIDALITAHMANASPPSPPSPVPRPPVAFEDWVPGVLSTLSLIVVNLIDKESLNASEWSYSGSNVATRARFCAFVGLTMGLGAICGAIVRLCSRLLLPHLLQFNHTQRTHL